MAAFGIVECCDKDHLANFLLFVPCPPYTPSQKFVNPWSILIGIEGEEITNPVATCQVVVTLLICSSKEGIREIADLLESLLDEIYDNPSHVFYRTHT